MESWCDWGWIFLGIGSVDGCFGLREGYVPRAWVMKELCASGRREDIVSRMRTIMMGFGMYTIGSSAIS